MVFFPRRGMTVHLSSIVHTLCNLEQKMQHFRHSALFYVGTGVLSTILGISTPLMQYVSVLLTLCVHSSLLGSIA